MHLIGIEFSKTVIKCVEVVKHRQKLLIKKGHLLEITPQYNKEKIIRWIQKRYTLKGFPKKKLVIVINDSQTIVRQLIIPIESELTIKQQLEIKPEIYLPIERGTHQIRFKILTPLEEQKDKMVVQFVAVPNTMIYDTLSLSKKLKGNLVNINIPSESIIKFFSGQEPTIGQIGQHYIIVDIGVETTQIIVIESNGGYLVRTVHFGTQHMTALAQDYFEETYQTFDKNQLIKLMYLQVDYYIVLEIERLLKFYETRYVSFDIQGVYLMSTLKTVEETQIRTYLSQALNIETYLVHTIKDIESPLETVAPFLYLLGAIKAL